MKCEYLAEVVRVEKLTDDRFDIAVRWIVLPQLEMEKAFIR
jgi:hypothetical protein